MRSILASAALALTLVSFVTPADAAPITYEFSGIGTGSIGGTAFTDAFVVFTPLSLVQARLLEPLEQGGQRA